MQTYTIEYTNPNRADSYVVQKGANSAAVANIKRMAKQYPGSVQDLVITAHYKKGDKIVWPK